MDGAGARAPSSLQTVMLDRMMPMHLVLASDTTILTFGPTMAKLIGPDALGQRLDRIFDLRRPRTLSGVEDLIEQPMLSLALHDDARTRFKGLAVRLDDEAVAGLGTGGALINLSFGYALVEAVRQHGLSEQDFAATDLAIEMLYLIEAKAIVTREVERMTLRLREAKHQAEARAQTDALTGLGNRRAFDEVIDGLLSRRRPFCLVNVDLDFFKQVNDTLGHAAGDHVLIEIASHLRGVVRAGDCVARMGGDEFAILLEGVSDTAPLISICERLLRRVSAPIDYHGQPCKVALSMGAVMAPANTPHDASALIAQADSALYASKRNGRRRLTLYETDNSLRELVALSSEIVERRGAAR